MKSFHSKLSGVAPFIFFPLLLLLLKKRKITYVVFFLLTISLSSCFLNFYRTNTKPSIDETTASQLLSENKYFIVHFLNSTNGLENIYITGDSLHGTVVPLPVEHSNYLYPIPTSSRNKVKAADKKNALIEVHLYTTQLFKGADSLNQNDSLFTASLSSFNRADVYSLNKSATSTNHILSIAGIALTVGAIVGTLVASLSDPSPPPSSGDCNCPQLYVNNNGEYKFTSGLYSGAVYSTLERMDYLPLTTILPGANNINLKITNDKNEEQFINKVSLMQVSHPTDVNVLADRHGEILSYTNITAPAMAITKGEDDIKDVLTKTDNNYYSFDNNSNSDGFSDLQLLFYKPLTASEAKLIIHARNTFWGGLLHKEFLSLFGDSFEKWREKQEKADPKELEKWQIDQALPLMVYLKTDIGWKFIDYFPLIGNTASRDLIMKINTKEIKGDKIELKLQTAYRFWDLDLAAIDYSSNESFTTTVIEPEEAYKSDNTNQKEVLQNSDKQYTHLINDEFISFKYPIPATLEDKVSSYFLISGGYYHNLEKFTNKADYKELIKFRKKGAFDNFSRKKYQQALNLTKLLKEYTNK